VTLAAARLAAATIGSTLAVDGVVNELVLQNETLVFTVLVTAEDPKVTARIALYATENVFVAGTLLKLAAPDRAPVVEMIADLQINTPYVRVSPRPADLEQLWVRVEFPLARDEQPVLSRTAIRTAWHVVLGAVGRLEKRFPGALIPILRGDVPIILVDILAASARPTSASSDDE
jgi:hypothetical protein